MKAIQYGAYLQLDRILNSQRLESAEHGAAAHDEMLFIITHQAYELWFKQILHELEAVIDVFDDPLVEDRKMGQVIHWLGRIKVIQHLLLQQIDVIETMTPLDFLDFRDLLVPASGFQSIQFKMIEIALGLTHDQRIPADRDFFRTRLSPAEREQLEQYERRPSLFVLTDRWLARMPFLKYGNFEFWQHYSAAVDQMLASDRTIVELNPAITDNQREVQLANLEQMKHRFRSLLDEADYERARQAGEFQLSHRSFLAALFIHLYRDEPINQLPFRFLTALTEIDELFTTWRARHALMVQRMLGTKIGTGGSAGHQYLSRTTEHNRVFKDLFNISTFLLPRSALPKLPAELYQALGFRNGTIVSND